MRAMIKPLTARALLCCAALTMTTAAACSGPEAKPDKPPGEQLDLDGPTAEQLQKAPCANPRWLAPPPGMPQTETPKPAEDTTK